MASTFNIHEAKTHLSDLLAKAMAGEEVIIAKANKPLVRLVPVEPARRERVPGLGATAKFEMSPDFDAPLTEMEDWYPTDPLASSAESVREPEPKVRALRRVTRK